MRQRLSLLLILALALPSCAGLTARQEALLPALRLAWPGVQSDITTGIESGVENNRLTMSAAANLVLARDATGAALDTGDMASLAAVPWLMLKDEAEAGIKHRVRTGEISAGVSESLKERVRQFTAARATFLSSR